MYDAALLNSDLNGSSAEPVAAALHEKAIPFTVFTGYDASRLVGLLREAPYVAKPCRDGELIAAVDRMRSFVPPEKLKASPVNLR